MFSNCAGSKPGRGGRGAGAPGAGGQAEAQQGARGQGPARGLGEGQGDSGSGGPLPTQPGLTHRSALTHTHTYTHSYRQQGKRKWAERNNPACIKRICSNGTVGAPPSLGRSSLSFSGLEKERKVSMRLHRGAPVNISSSDLTGRQDASRMSSQVTQRPPAWFRENQTIR